MFCTSLRRRSSFSSIIPSLTSPAGLTLKESHLKTHDIAVKLPTLSPPIPDRRPNRILRFLLLSPNNVSELKLPTILSRIQHFASLTGGEDVAIILALSTPQPFTSDRSLAPGLKQGDNITEGLISYARLQSALIARSDIPWILILPLAKLDDLVALVKSHIQAAARPKPALTSVVPAMDLLAHCTTEPPLAPLAVNLISDVFPSLAHLACAGVAHKSDEGSSVDDSTSWDASDGSMGSGNPKAAFDLLEGQLGADTVGGVLEFWADDWVID